MSITAKKRILFLAEAVTLAHVVRPLVLAQALPSEEYEVHFAADPRYDFVFQNSPIPRNHTLSSISCQQFLDALASGSRLYQRATLVAYIAEDRQLIERVQPDLVVGDFRVSLAVSAPLCGVPYATIANAHWSPYSARRGMPLPEHAIERIFGTRLGTFFFRLVQPAIFRYHAWPLNRLRRQHGLGTLGDLRGTYTHADYTWYADIPSIAPTQDLPENHQYLGAIPWSPAAVLPRWWEELDAQEPVVYATLGTSGNTRVLPNLFEAVASLPLRMLFASAGRFPAEAVPPNVLVADYLPGDLAAARARAVICNGGSAGVYQALGQGTPVLGVPSNMDQHLTMEAVAGYGAGILVRRRHADPVSLRHALSRLVEQPSYTDRARALAEELGSFDAPANFRRWVAAAISRAAGA